MGREGGGGRGEVGGGTGGGKDKDNGSRHAERSLKIRSYPG